MKKLERLKRFGPVESNNEMPSRRKRKPDINDENDDHDQDHFKSVREEGTYKY